MMKEEYIGKVYEDEFEFGQALMCALPGYVFLGEETKVPFSSAKRIDVYNEASEFDDDEDFEEERYTIEFIRSENETIEITDIF